MEGIWVAIITSIIAPVVLFGIQQIKARKDRTFTDLKNNINDLAISVKKIELQTMIYNRPKEISVIFAIFDEYKKLGGDSWADDLFLQWRAKYVKE